MTPAPPSQSTVTTPSVGAGRRAAQTGSPAQAPVPARRARWLAPVLSLGAVAALTAFAVLADGAVEGDDLSAYDPSVTSWVVAWRRGWLTGAAWVATHLGGALSLTVVTLLATAGFLRAGRLRHAVVLLAAMVSSSVVTVLLKLAFARERPSIDLLLGDPASTFSFPSGHSFNTAVLVGTLAGFVVFSGARSRWKVLAALGAASAAGAVGLSRVYLAYHWLTDVLAGWSLAVAWLCLAALVVLHLRRVRPARAR